MPSLLSIISTCGGILACLNVVCGQSLPVQNRIVFLGDSITYGGQYVELVETALWAEFPKRPWEIINVGLPSETVSGLSEDGHAGGKFPRPCVMERVDRVLEKTKPELLVICYGMNCGIYYPYEEKRAKLFRNGILKLREKAQACHAEVWHLTPPPFDAKPIRQRLLPAGLTEYPKPFVEYDDVLDRYSDWLTERRAQGWHVVDIHSLFGQALSDRRQSQPEFTFSPDGVHPNAEGHAVMAQSLLSAWGLKSQASQLAKQPSTKRLFSIVAERNQLMKDAWLTDTGHKRPGMKAGLPLPQAHEKETALLAEIQLCLPPKTP